MLVVVHFIQPFNTLLKKILKYVLLECPARPAGMSCYTGINRKSRTSSRTNRTPGNPGSVYLFIIFFMKIYGNCFGTFLMRPSVSFF